VNRNDVKYRRNRPGRICDFRPRKQEKKEKGLNNTVPYRKDDERKALGRGQSSATGVSILSGQLRHSTMTTEKKKEALWEKTPSAGLSRGAKQERTQNGASTGKETKRMLKKRGKDSIRDKRRLASKELKKKTAGGVPENAQAARSRGDAGKD